MGDEFELIEKITHLIPPCSPQVVKGIGDDCAVIKRKDGCYDLYTTDCLVDGVHFEKAQYTPFEVGKKALAVNLSDIAAMGGKPLYALISLGLPSDLPANWVSDFYTGMEQMAREYNVSVVGGNISGSPQALWISVTLVGEVRADQCKFRAGAKPGDSLFVTGPLGLAALGLNLIKKEKGGLGQTSPFLRALKTPRAEVNEGLFLAAEKGVHALIDISDGLVSDLKSLLSANESPLGARLSYDDIPRDPQFKALCRDYKLNEASLLLAGGEDYQLLFSVAPGVETGMIQRARVKGFRFSKIGVVTEIEKGFKILNSSGEEVEGNWVGYSH